MQTNILLQKQKLPQDVINVLRERILQIRERVEMADLVR
jgi:hypothetical protein